MQESNYLQRIYIVLGITYDLNLDTEACTCVVYANTIPFLCEGLEHPQILVSEAGGSWSQY